MKKRTKLLALLLTFIMALPLGLIACGGDVDEVNYVGTVKIGYARAGYGREFAEAWTEGYNLAHPDEQIKFVIDDAVDSGVIGGRLETNSQMCDIFMVLETGWHDWARAGWIEPLDDIMDDVNEDGKVFGDVLKDEYETYGIIDGKRYVLPQSGNAASGFAYDETLWKKHNLGEPPKTVDELKALVEKINNLPCNTDADEDNDIAPFAWGGMVAGYWNSPVYSWWAQYDGYDKVKEFFEMETVDVYSEENRPGLKKALELFRELICTGQGVPKNSLKGAISKNHVLMQNDFVLGKAAMLVGVNGLQNETEKLVDPDSVFKMFYTPYIDGAKVDQETGEPIKIGISLGQDFMFIPSASQNKELAKKFLVWISTEEMCRSYSRYSSFVAPYYYNTENIEGVSPLTQSLLDESEGIQMLGSIYSSNPIVMQLRLGIWGGNTAPYESMVVNNLTPSQALRNAESFARSQWQALQNEFFGKD